VFHTDAPIAFSFPFRPTFYCFLGWILKNKKYLDAIAVVEDEEHQFLVGAVADVVADLVDPGGQQQRQALPHAPDQEELGRRPQHYHRRDHIANVPQHLHAETTQKSHIFNLENKF
jgi:hypothetical protein